MKLRMPTKLDENGIEIYTIESRKDAIIALKNLKEDISDNKLYDFFRQIENAMKAIKEGADKDVLNIKHKTNCKPLYQILYIYEKDYLYKQWELQ